VEEVKIKPKTVSPKMDQRKTEKSLQKLALDHELPVAPDIWKQIANLATQ